LSEAGTVPLAAASGGSLLLVTHGIEGRPGVALAHAEALRAREPAADVRVACLKGEPDLDSALAGARTPVTVVPLLMADGFIMRLLRSRLVAKNGIALRPPVGTDPRLTALIMAKARHACAERGWLPARTTLLLIGHGTPQHAGSEAATTRHAETLAVPGIFADVRTAYLDQASFLAAAAAALDRPCVAVGLFVDDGPHGRDDVLEGLAAAAAPVAYTGAIGTDPAILGLIAAAT
jgi:sirohydrochlorin cobaltochelatase